MFQELWQDREFRWFLFGLLSFWVGAGLYGAAWISDSYDDWRTPMLGYAGLPVTFLFYALFIFRRDWWRRWPVFFAWMLGAVILVNSWGNLLLLNALGDEQPTRVDMAVKGVTIDGTYSRGGFGWIYRTRW